MELDELYAEGEDNPCVDCSIFNKNKPFHAYMDHEEEDFDECDVLFLSDSLKYSKGSKIAFRATDIELIADCMPDDIKDIKFGFSATIKCPGVRKGDMGATNKKICREYLGNTVDIAKPKLIFTCGNLAMDMLIKKSGMIGKTGKRGRIFDYETPEGHKCKVIPIFHPFSVIQEPANRYLFETDIKNGINTIIKGQTAETEVEYDVHMEIGPLISDLTYIIENEDIIAIDIETTGLNFREDKIMTIAISTDSKTFVFPYQHKEMGWSEDAMRGINYNMGRILELKRIKKVFHNAKFDLKFMCRHTGCAPEDLKNIACTLLLSHCINENSPNSLLDNVIEHFPGVIKGE